MSAFAVGACTLAVGVGDIQKAFAEEYGEEGGIKHVTHITGAASSRVGAGGGGERVVAVRCFLLDEDGRASPAHLVEFALAEREVLAGESLGERDEEGAFF